jgi:hypothetical protein
MTRARFAVLAVATALMAVGLTTTGAGAAGLSAETSASKPYGFFNLFDDPLIKPKTVSLTANSGPYLEEVRWSGWGKKTSKATAIFVDNHGNAPGAAERRPALITVSRPKYCAKHKVYAYRTVYFQIVANDGSKKKYNLGGHYDLYCK